MPILAIIAPALIYVIGFAYCLPIAYRWCKDGDDFDKPRTNLLLKVVGTFGFSVVWFVFLPVWFVFSPAPFARF